MFSYCGHRSTSVPSKTDWHDVNVILVSLIIIHKRKMKEGKGGGGGGKCKKSVRKKGGSVNYKKLVRKKGIRLSMNSPFSVVHNKCVLGVVSIYSVQIRIYRIYVQE